MAFSDPAYRAFPKHHAVVLYQLVHHLRKGDVCTKVGDHALQRPRTTSIADLGALCERAKPLGRPAILRLLYSDVAKRGVPAQFFLPSRQADPLV
jgi:hypothetical protein